MNEAIFIAICAFLIIFTPGVYPEFGVQSSYGRGVLIILIISAWIVLNLALIVYDQVIEWALPVLRRRQNIIEFRNTHRHAAVLINQRNKHQAKLLAEHRSKKRKLTKHQKGID